MEKQENTHTTGYQVSVRGRAQPLAHKVAHMTKDDENQITDVGREKNVVGRVLLHVHGKGSIRRAMFRGVSVRLVCAVTKLSVYGGEHLF